MTTPENGAMRLDQLLVKRGLSATRTRARADVEAGGVRVDGVIVQKPSLKVALDAELDLQPAYPWASRGGVKLAHALDAFSVDPAGFVCVDVGASTGGFTDVLLNRGALRVYAVDVGRDQLVARLQRDERVVSLEGVDARRLDASLVCQTPKLVVCDASFIGLEKVLPAALRLCPAGAMLVALFKPQFQVGPNHVGKGGIVSDLDAADAAAHAFEAWLADAGWRLKGWTASPILGGDGNAERLLYATRRDQVGD